MAAITMSVTRGGPVFEANLQCGNRSARIRRVKSGKHVHFTVSIDGRLINSFLLMRRARSFVRSRLRWA